MKPFAEIFSELLEPRTENALHDLRELLFTALLATLCGEPAARGYGRSGQPSVVGPRSGAAAIRCPARSPMMGAAELIDDIAKRLPQPRIWSGAASNGKCNELVRRAGPTPNASC